MEKMLQSLAPVLTQGAKVLSRTVECGCGEGVIATPLAAVAAAHPDVTIGSYPTFTNGGFSTRLVIRSRDAAALEAAAMAVETIVAEATGNAPPAARTDY
jgi:molybdopterin-biosynthesis enzyme MoeA-like protein